jgi:hypothetical protein
MLEPKSTSLQKGSYKLYQRQIAEALNDGGLTLRKAIETGKLNLEMPWTEFTVQQIFTESYLTHLYPDAKSISDLSTTQLTDLHKHVDQGISTVFGVSIPFPSEEALRESKK